MYSLIGVEGSKPDTINKKRSLNSRIYTRGRLGHLRPLRRLRRHSINTGDKADALIFRRIKRLRLSASNR